MWESSPRFSLLLFVPGSLHGRGYPRSIFFLAYIYSSTEVQPSARCCVTTSREEPLSKAVTYDLSVPAASSVSRLRFCQMAIAVSSLSLFLFFLFQRTLGTYSVSRIRDILLLGSFGIIYWSPMKSASSRFFSPKRRLKSDWARIQRDANFPADVIPVKLKKRVMRRKDRWFTRIGDFILYII